METPVYVYDPTAKDAQSKVRGVGRYVQILRENFPNFIFTADLKSVPKNAILINPFVNLLAPQTVNKRYAKRQIGIIHDLIPFKYPQHFPIGMIEKIRVFFRKFALENYDLFITDSEVSKNDIIKILHIRPQRIQVIYPTITRLFLPHLKSPLDENSKELFQHGANGLQPTFTSVDKQFTQNEKITQLDNYILYVGDATWNKNLSTLVKAVKSANITCVCVGKVFENIDPLKLTHPWQAELRYFVQETINDKRFVILGYVTDLELLYLYKNARMNLLISHDEGFGFSYVEAGIFSTPSILADSPIFHEIAKESALFAKPLDPMDVASKIGEIYFNPHRREIYSLKAFERAEDFSPHLFQENWKKVLATLRI